MNVYARFDEILSMTLLSYVGNSVYAYTQAIKNYKGKLLSYKWPLVHTFLS